MLVRKNMKKVGIAVLALGVVAMLAVLAIDKHAQAVQAKAERDAQIAAEAAEKAAQQEELAEKQRQQQAVERHNKALASVHFDSDPNNELPVMSIGELTKRLYDRRNSFGLTPGQRVRILATLQEENFAHNALHFRESPAAFLYQNYDFTIPGFLLDHFRPGDEVEFIVSYDGEKDDSVEGRYESSTMYFNGMDIQKVPVN